MKRVILFDLGSTLWDDYPTELFQWRLLRRLLEPFGIIVSEEQIDALVPQVIASYCPSLTRGLAFRLCDGDAAISRQVMDRLAAEMLSKFEDRDAFLKLNPLFDGVKGMLTGLAKDFRLGVISQNYAQADKWMEWSGIRHFFGHVTLSSRNGIFKPDPRLFAGACVSMGVAPSDCVMVGDRLDNDIWPANRLQMTTVRVLAGPFRCQQPRYERDVPDFTIERIADLPAVLAPAAGDSTVQ